MVGDEFGMQHDITVNLHDVITLGPGYCLVAYGGKPESLILLPDMHHREFCLFGEPVYHFRGRVSRAVISDYHLIRVGGLTQNAAQANFKCFRGVVCGYDQGDSHQSVNLQL